MSGEMTEVLTAIGGLTEAVTTLKKDFNSQSIATEKYRTYIHEGNSVRDKQINTMELLLERVIPLVETHEQIASSINNKYLGNLDEHHSYIAKQIAKENFWVSLRESLLTKGAMMIMVLVIAALAYMSGLEEFAKKLSGLG